MGVFLKMRGLRILRWCASFDHVAADLIAVGDLSYMGEEVLAFVGAVSDREWVWWSIFRGRRPLLQIKRPHPF
jgi:hypothetical protein